MSFWQKILKKFGLEYRTGWSCEPGTLYLDGEKFELARRFIAPARGGFGLVEAFYSPGRYRRGRILTHWTAGVVRWVPDEA